MNDEAPIFLSDLTPEERYAVSQAPWAWRNRGRRLAVAAEILFREMDPHDELHLLGAIFASYEAQQEGRALNRYPAPDYVTPLMLYAYAIENILKGIVLASDTTTISMSELASDICVHNLPRLWKQAGLPLSEEDKKFLQVLTEFGIWAGRYPVARYQRDHEAHFQYGRADEHEIVRRSGREKARELFESAETELLRVGEGFENNDDLKDGGVIYWKK